MITKSGKRALTIYDYIIQEKKENDSTRVILLSGTPAVNTPYELALIFNLLRPDIFPKTETKFNEIYITRNAKEHTLNPQTKNMFQRRILGLVSYYIGSDPELFASKHVHQKNLMMDSYQLQVYENNEYIEDQLEKARAQNKSGATVYRSYTRQASNFVFPVMGGNFVGENRPRPSKFKLSEKEANDIISGKEITDDKRDFNAIRKNISMYLQAVESFIKKFINHFDELILEDEKSGKTLKKDIEIYKTTYKYKFTEFWNNHKTKSSLLQKMYSCSCKMTAIIFYIMKSKGPVLVFSNFVKMEGLEIFKIYLSYFGYSDFSKGGGTDNYRYTEFHGEIEKDVRKTNLANYNSTDNIFGKKIMPKLLPIVIIMINRA
jgi:SNF2 family DNA or RNA helicase